MFSFLSNMKFRELGHVPSQKLLSLILNLSQSDNTTTNNAFGDADVRAISSDQSHPFNQRDFAVAVFLLICSAFLLETFHSWERARIPCRQRYDL